MRLTLSSASGTPDENDAQAPNRTVGRASFWGLRIDTSSRTVSTWLMACFASHQQPRTSGEREALSARCRVRKTLLAGTPRFCALGTPARSRKDLPRHFCSGSDPSPTRTREAGSGGLRKDAPGHRLRARANSGSSQGPGLELCQPTSIYPRQYLLQDRKELRPPALGALGVLLLIRPEARLLHAQVGTRAPVRV